MHHHASPFHHASKIDHHLLLMTGNLISVQHENENRSFHFRVCLFITHFYHFSTNHYLRDDQFSTKKETAGFQFRVCLFIAILHFIVLACISILHDDQFSTKKETAVLIFMFHRKIFHIAKPPARASTRAIFSSS